MPLQQFSFWLIIIWISWFYCAKQLWSFLNCYLTFNKVKKQGSNYPLYQPRTVCICPPKKIHFCDMTKRFRHFTDPSSDSNVFDTDGANTWLDTPVQGLLLQALSLNTGAAVHLGLIKNGFRSCVPASLPGSSLEYAGVRRASRTSLLNPVCACMVLLFWFNTTMPPISILLPSLIIYASFRLSPSRRWGWWDNGY